MGVVKMRQGNDGILKMINYYLANTVMAEIGCYAGESSYLFMKSGKISKFYAIDPWRSGYDKRDPASQSDMVLVEKLFDDRVKGWDIVKLKMTFNEAFDLLPELDAVYIDGHHSYDAVFNDISLALKKVKSGGIISGHDYRTTNPIVMAVNDLLGKPDMIFQDTSWLIYK